MRLLSTFLIATLAAGSLARPHHDSNGRPVSRPWWNFWDDDSPEEGDIPGTHKSVFSNIPDEYIILLNDNSTVSDLDDIEAWTTDLHRRHLAKRGDVSGRQWRGMKHRWNRDKRFKGFSGQFTPETVEEIKSRPEVALVEPAKTVSIFETVLHEKAQWGLARISRKVNNLRDDGQARYFYDSSAGAGTTVYVVDTGINVDHVEFEGRASFGAAFVEGSSKLDRQGHGTHVAGIIAGKTYGVARKAKVVAVKVLNDYGHGSNADVVDGIQWIMNHAEDNGIKNPIINMSLGGDYAEAVNKVVEAATARGALFIVAAGNRNEDAMTFSPASSPNAITVGAIDHADNRAYFSNYGPILDLFAPGTGILSASNHTTTSTQVRSGTSMACPHVAGVAAYFVGLGYSVDEVRSLLIETSSRGVKESVGGSPNRIVFNGGGKKVIV